MLRLFPALVLSLGLAGPGTVSAAPLITVETAPGDDAAIIDGVKRTHAPDPRTKLFEVTAETSGGITVLKGRTDSAEALSDLRAAYYVQKRPVDVRVKLLPDSDDLKKKVWAFTTVPAGTPAARLDEKDGMTLLRLPDGSIGLARSTDVRPCTETEILIRNRHERLIVTADEAVFKPLQEESAPSADVVLPRGAILRLDGAGDGVMRTALPDGRRGTIAVSAVEKLADFERREESERRSDPAAFMKALSETAVREATSGRHADGGSFLRSVFLARDLIVQRDPDMLLAAYPKADGGRSLDRFKPGDVLVFRPVNGVRAAGISLGGSRFVSVPDMGGDFRKGGAKARAALRKSLEGAVRIDPGFLNDPCLTSTRSNPYWQAPVKALVPCSRRADIEMIR